LANVNIYIPVFGHILNYCQVILYRF